MGADMLTAMIATPADRTAPPDFEAGRAALAQVQDPSLFDFGDPIAEIDALLPDLDPDIEVVDENFVPVLAFAQQAGRAIIDNLQQHLPGSREVDTLLVGGYRVYVSAGPSWGDPPTDAAEAIWDAYKLPDQVLTAMGFVPDCSRPPTSFGA